MSITNLGNQYITFDYKHPATAKDFNTLLKGAIKPGIYSGGGITITGANTISVAPFIAYLYSDTDKLVRVETRLAVALTIAESTPVLSITLPWANVVENWLDWNQRAHGSTVITNEVCLGEMIFVDSAINSIDYTVKNWGKQLESDVTTGQSPITVTSTTKVTNLNVDQVDSCDVETYLTNSSSKIPRSDAVYSAIYRLGSTIRLERTYTAISATNPWFCLSLTDRDWTTAHFSADFIAEMRTRKVIYDEMGASPVSSFGGAWAGDTFTLTNNAANVAMITTLAREYLYAGSPTTNWRLLHDGTNEFNVIAISVSARTIKVNLDSKTATGTAIEIYRHRVYGSTTSARHFSEAGLGFYQAGGDKISGLRRLDQMQQITGYAVNNSNSLSWGQDAKTVSGALKFSSATGQFANSAGTQSGQPRGIEFDSANSPDARTGSKTEIEAGTLLAYIYVGEYTE